MKKIFLFTFLVITLAGNASFHSKFNIQNSTQSIDSIPADSKDVSSIDAILKALYDVISGPGNEKRNWDRMRTLFIPEAKMIPTGKRTDGSFSKRVLTVEDYITSSGPYLEKNGFFEKEISNKTEVYGNIAHVFSTYESRHTAADEKPFVRGINSIQLWNDGSRWWIINIFWQGETPENPLPAKYLN
ncbi:MAG: hypothetical protein JWN76_762 [Chitinophagaceae bacterium]|nr:hypothetical protein [Chitinophagaceae bacterium]